MIFGRVVFRRGVHAPNSTTERRQNSKKNCNSNKPKRFRAVATAQPRTRLQKDNNRPPAGAQPPVPGRRRSSGAQPPLSARQEIDRRPDLRAAGPGGGGPR